MSVQHIIKQLNSVLNFALNMQCQKEATCIRNCINEITRLQKLHIPNANIQYFPCDITREQAAQFKNIPIIGDGIPPGMFYNPK